MTNMKLKRIVGFTTNGQHSLIVQPNTGKLIYFAGCVAVIVDPRNKGSQEQLISSSKQNITCHAITEDGKYLATADCGALATIRVWSLERMALEAEIVGRHSAELACMAFSSDGRTLVSVGGQQDMNLFVWDWRAQLPIASQKLLAKVRAVSFAADGSYFVTVGDAAIKYWSLSQPEGALVSRSATLGEQKRASFCDVSCGRGPMSEATFCLTKNGILCELNSRRLLHKWVDLRTSLASSIRCGPSVLLVACANGVARCFSTQELRFLKNLPRPHALGRSTSGAESGQISSSAYPHTISADLDETSGTIACVYNDHSIYCWDYAQGLANPTPIHTALYHSSCIWGLDMYPSSAKRQSRVLPAGSFVTCSSDETVRIWKPRLLQMEPRPSRANGHSASEPNQPDEMLKILFTNSSNKFLCDADPLDKTNLDYDSSQGLRCLKISPDGKHLAVGARAGTIKIFDLSPSEKPESVMLKSIAAHDAEVLCLEYSDPDRFNGFYYLASSSRDKLIHLFDAEADYQFLQTIDDHTSSITALRFVNNRANDCLQLVSCGADRKIIFRNGLEVKQADSARPKLEFVADQQIEGKTTFYDMEVDSESSCLMLACQDRMVRLFSVAQGRYQSGFSGSLTDHGTLIKVALDPSCTFLAASSTDKSISIYDYQRGERIASVSEGLADLVTDLKFSRDGRYLVASTGDGCIFIWSSPSEIANTVSSHLDLPQLTSLSSCSLNSMTGNAQEEVIDARQHQRARWPAEDLSGADSAGSDLGASNRLYRVVQADESQLSGSILRGSRGQTTNSSAEDNGSDANAQQSPQPSGICRVFRHTNQAESTHKVSGKMTTSWRRSNSRTRDEAGPNSAGLVSSMAKLFQSRDNLDKISTREQFVAEGLALSSKVAPVASTRTSLTGSHLKPAKITQGDDEETSDEEAQGPLPASPLRSRSLGRRATAKSLPKESAQAKLDWSTLDPNKVELSRELCQQLIDNLQAVSKFVTRLHPRLQAAERRDLASLLARGVQNSMDILSIVPARSQSGLRSSGPSNATLANRGQHQSQANLSTSSTARRRAQSQHPQTRATSSSRPGSATGLVRAIPVSTMGRQSRLDAATARSRAPTTPQTNTMVRTASTGSGLNIDQVLEAYSDRLFRMVQERMAVGQQQQQHANGPG